MKKTIDERETDKQQQQQQCKDRKYVCCVFNLGFLQLICKDSLFFKSNLELALSIILKERELYKSKYVAVECICLKI